MSDMVTKSFRISEECENRLLNFCQLNSMKPSEVMRAALSQFIGPSLPQNLYYMPPLEATNTADLKSDCNTKFSEPRAQECLNHKYNTEYKKENNKEKRSSTSQPPVSPIDEAPLPDGLDCPEFQQAWKEFIAHRREIKKRFTERAKAMTLKRLSKFSVTDAIEAIHASIANGWQGLDPEWIKQRKSNGTEIIKGPDEDPNYYDDPV